MLRFAVRLRPLMTAWIASLPFVNLHTNSEVA
jgi:hypothetical protein